jgi:hypothetical protein
MRLVRLALSLGVVGFLVVSIRDVGWQDITRTLPTHPLFYALNLLVYLSIPLADILAYGKIWHRPLWFAMPAFLQKRIFNQDVVGYSGEVFFAHWATRTLGLSAGEVLRTVRDHNILSAVASTMIAVTLVALYLTFGHVRLQDVFDRQVLAILIAVAAGTAVLLPVAIRFRRSLFAMPRRLAATVFGLLCTRLLIGQAGRIGQWSLAMPDTPVEVWLTLAAASLILSRIPFVPSQDLLFVGIGVEMSSMLGVSEAAMFSMLAVSSALDKMLNLFLYVSFAIRGTNRILPQ